MLHRFKGFQFCNFKKLYKAILKMWLLLNFGFVKFESLKSNHDVLDVCVSCLSVACVVPTHSLTLLLFSLSL